MKKTLNILEFPEGRYTHLVTFYAADLIEAVRTALGCARDHQVIPSHGPRIAPHPEGLTIHCRSPPGHIEVEDEVSEQKERPEA